MIYNLQAEQNVIGAILYLDGFGDAVESALDSLDVADFYSQQHKKIFSAMKDLKSRDVSPSFEAVIGHRFCEDDYLYIAEVHKNTYSGINLNKYAEGVKKVSTLRMTQERVNSINEIICSSGDIDEKLSEIEQLFSVDIGFTNVEVGAKHIFDCMPTYIEKLADRWENPESVIFSTGIPDLDNVLGGGFEIGLHAIAARPKMGKTELMGKMINHFAVDRKKPVYVGSLEMPDFQVIERLVSSYGKIDKQEIKNNFENAHDEDLARGAFQRSCYEVGNADIYIDDRHSNSVKKIRRECLKIQKKHGEIGGIFVDYLTLLETDGKYDRHDLAVAGMTRALKGMSKEFKCPVIMLLQLNRGLESRQDKRPMPSDSRDSGAIEQDVDSWTALYRDSVYNEDSHWKMITEIIVRLNRHGGSGTAYQLLTGSGFKDVNENEVANLIHMEEANKAVKQSNQSQHKTSGF
jgi:replicative DNA helicase